MLKRRFVIPNFFYSLSTRLSATVFNVGSFLILVRILTKAEVGYWALLLTVLTMAEMAKGALLRNATIKLFNENHTDRHPAILSASLLLNGLIAVVLAGGALGSGWLPFVVSPMTELLAYSAVTLLLLVPYHHFEYLLQAKGQFKEVMVAYLLRQGLFFGGLLWLWLTPMAVDFFRIMLAQWVGVATASLYLLVRYGGLVQLVRPAGHWFTDIWAYGRYMLFTNLNAILFRNTDQFMVAALVSPVAVAYYNVAIRLINFLDMPSTAFAETSFPRCVALNAEKRVREIAYLYERAVGLTLALLLPIGIGIVLFARPIVTLLADESYLPAVGVLYIMIGYSLFLPFLKQFGMVMDATGRQALNTWIIFALAILNVAANYVFTRLFGLEGAALGTLFVYVAGMIVSYYFVRKHYPVSLKGVFKYLLQGYTRPLSLLPTRDRAEASKLHSEKSAA